MYNNLLIYIGTLFIVPYGNVYARGAGYKFNVKLTKYNVLSNAFNETVNIYLDNMKTSNSQYYTDTTFVCNKLGEDLVSNNPQIKKHKTSKISIISDNFNIPISITIDTGSKHDVSIIREQLTDLHNSPRSGRIRP